MISLDEMELDFSGHAEYAMMTSENESSPRQLHSKRSLVPQSRRPRKSKPSPKRLYNWCDDCDDIHPAAIHSSTAGSQNCPQLALGLEQKQVEAFALRLIQPLGWQHTAQPAAQSFCLGNVRHWSCGFCSKLWSSHSSYKSHVHEHLRNQQHRPKRWKHSLVISGLLKQPNIRNAWQAIIDKTMLFRRFQWDEASTGRAPLWMSTYGRAMQLQDYLERFNGSKEDAQELAQLAFDLSRQAAWLRERSPRLLARIGGKRHEAPLLEYYRGKPLPGRPRRPLTRHIGKVTLGHKRASAVSNGGIAQRQVPGQNRTGQSDSSCVNKKRSENNQDCSDHHPGSGTDNSNQSSGSSSESQSSDEDMITTSGEEGSLTKIGTNGAFTTMLRRLIESTMQEFWDRWNQGDQRDVEMVEAETNSQGGQARTESCHDANTVQSMGFGAGAFKRKRSTSDNSSEDEGNNRRRPPRKLSKQSAQDDLHTKKPKLACPFRKHDPTRYSLATHQVCAASGWTSIHRLKEHLNRCHRAIYCPRCKTTFKTKPARDAHLNVPSLEICQAREDVMIEGITDEQESQLRSRKKKSHDQTEEDRWAGIYSLLFPLEAIPSPYFEPISDAGGHGPTSGGFQECEGYIRRQVPRLVQRQLIEMARQDLAPVEQRLMSNLQEIIQNCIETAFSQYREEQHTAGEGQTAGSSQSFPSVDSSMTEPTAPPNTDTLNHDVFYMATGTELDFLDSIYAVPPALSEDAMHLSPTALDVQPAQVGVAHTDSGYTSGHVCDPAEASHEDGGSCFGSFAEDPFVGELDEMGKFNFWGARR